MKLAPKLLAPLVALSLTVVAVVALAVALKMRVSQANEHVILGKKEIILAADMRGLSRGVQRDVLKAVLAQTQDERAPFVAGADRRLAELKQVTAKLAGILAGNGSAAMKTVVADQDKLDAALRKVMDLAAAGPPAAAYEAFQQQVQPLEQAVSRQVDAFIDEQSKVVAVAETRANDLETLALRLQIGASVVGLILSLGFGVAVVSFGVVRPMRTLTGRIAGMVGGDLDAAVAGTARKDEIGDIARALDTFRGQLAEGIRVREEAEAARLASEAERQRREAADRAAAAAQAEVVETLGHGLAALAEGKLLFRVSQGFPADYEKLRADFNSAMAQLEQAMQTIAANTQSISGGTGEIASAAGDMSRRVEQQAASLEETAAALDEISATVKRTADSAGEARLAADTARSQAESSRQVVTEAVHAMTRIEQSAKEISQIIGVIDEIAFQTNLLALNAGVEAARAGEAGKGFAVVASEVRALAQRSAEAAKEIKGLITASGEQVQAGVTLVGRTDEALAGITAQFERITALVTEIASSAAEQATAIAQVNTAVTEIDRTTQQNAAMVEESTAASRNLAEETAELATLIARFEVAGAPAARAGAAGRPHAPHSPPPRHARAVAAGGAAAQRRPDASPEDETWEEF